MGENRGTASLFIEQIERSFWAIEACSKAGPAGQVTCLAPLAGRCAFAFGRRRLYVPGEVRGSWRAAAFVLVSGGGLVRGSVPKGNAENKSLVSLITRGERRQPFSLTRSRSWRTASVSFVALSAKASFTALRIEMVAPRVTGWHRVHAIAVQGGRRLILRRDLDCCALHAARFEIPSINGSRKADFSISGPLTEKADGRRRETRLGRPVPAATVRSTCLLPPITA